MGNMVIANHIAAPAERVFELCSDFRGAADRVQGITKIEMLTEGSVRVGTRFRETRVMFGRECTEEMEVTEFTPNQSYTLGCESCGCSYSTQIRLTPENGGTRIEFDMSWKPLTFMAKLMSPIGKLMSGTMKKCIAQDLIDLKQAAEQTAPRE